MKRLVFLLFLLVLLGTARQGEAFASVSPRDSHPYGITIEAKDPRLWVDQNAGEMQAAGLSWTRLQMHWAKDETSPGVYNFAQDDSEMALAKKYNLMVDWPVQATPSWDIQAGCQQVPEAAPMAAYAVAVAKRYGTQLKAMEVGNEEWSFDHTAACKTPDNYAQVFGTVAQALRGAGYSGLIGTFGYTNYSSTDQIQAWWTTFLLNPVSRLANYGNFHFYHEGADPNIDLSGKPSLPHILAALHAAAVASGHAMKPFWLTETGYRTHCDALHPAPCNAVPPDTQANYEHAIFEDGRLSAGVLDHVFLYTLEPGAQVMSIVQNGVPLPAYTMAQNEIALYPSW